MTDIETAVGYVFAWAARKTKRVVGQPDTEVDRTLDRLHGLISVKLGEDPGLRKLAEEAGTGHAMPSGHTGQRVRLALEDAAEQDPGFAQAVDRAVQQVQAAMDRAAGSAAAGDNGVAVGGSVHIQSDHGSVAAAVLKGNVTLGGPPLARRSRVLLAVLPVVVAGGAIMAVTFRPYPPSTPGAGRPSPSPASSQPPSPSASTSPSGASSATRPPSGPAAGAPGSSPTGPQSSRTGEAHNPATEPRPPAKPQPKPKPETLSPGSVSRLQNASTHQCVSGDGSVYPAFGTCSSSDAYAWTLRATGGNTFELVNRASGSCLSAPNVNNYAAGLESCSSGYGGTGNVQWRVGSTTAAGQTLQNTETGHCLEIASPSYGGDKGVMVTTCNSDQPEQLWRNDGTT